MSCHKLHAQKKKSQIEIKKNYFLFLKSQIGIPKVDANFHFDVEVGLYFPFYC